MREDQVVRTLDTARGMNPHEPKAMIGAKQAQKLLGDRGRKAKTRVTRELVVEAIDTEKLEQGPRHSDASVVGGGIEGDKAGEMVDDHVDADVA